MKYLKLFEGYQTESEVAEICRKYNIENWTLNSDGLVDVNGDVHLAFKRLNKIPLKFGTVTGDFDFDCNRLTSLEGASHTVDNFFIFDNEKIYTDKLTSFEFAPKYVGAGFSCRGHNIRSFEGLVNIGGYFICDGSPLNEIWSLIKDEFVNNWDNEQMDFFNDLDIIRGEEIAIERLNFFLEEIGKEPVESVKGYKNIY